MKSIRHYDRNRPLFSLAAIVVAVFVTWVNAGAMDQERMKVLRQQSLERLSKQMRTVCVGRFHVDMPAEVELDLGNARVHGFDIATSSEDASDFQSRLADRKAQLEATKDWLGEHRNLELAKPVQSEHGVSGTIFLHGRTVTEGTRARGLELERYRYENVALEALLHAHGTSIDIEAAQYDPDQADNLSRLVGKLKPDLEYRSLSDPVFCVDKVHFRGPITADQGEGVIMRARLPSHPDIKFLLILTAGTKPDETGLLERSAAVQAGLPLLERMRLSTLRAGKRKIAHLEGEERIWRAVEKNGATVYSFWWEVNGTEDDVLEPHLVFQMMTGEGADGPRPSSLAEEAAFALWDRISSSIRLNNAKR